MATIGIDLGGTKVYGVRWIHGGIEAEERVLLTAQDDTRGAILALTRRLLTPEVRAVGIGVAGLVDRTTGSFAWGPHVAEVGLPLQPSPPWGATSALVWRVSWLSLIEISSSSAVGLAA